MIVRFSRPLHLWGNYYVKIRVPGSPNGLRKSLKTKDRKLATHLADQEYINVRARLQQGMSLFEPRLSELVKDYLDMKQEEADIGHITQGRINTIQSQINHMIKFIGDTYPSTLAVKVGGDFFKGYYKFRQKSRFRPFSKLKNI